MLTGVAYPLGVFRALPAAVAALSLSTASAPLAATVYADSVIGAEFPPITATVGTFRGVATGDLPGLWRVTIRHQPLSAGPSARITGGTFKMRTIDGDSIVSPVTSGSVTVRDSGAACGNQTYAIRAGLAVGSFSGTLVHHRASVLGHCVIFAATITGRANLTR